MMVVQAMVLLALWLGHASAATLGTVITEGGKVKGKNVRMGLLHYVDVFKGIPFADVPGRWEKPKPHPGWEGILKATEYRERCLQVTLLQMSSQGSEDCLYLNIFVPQGLTVSRGLPVMVYIFGGAFLLGASNDVDILGSDTLYDGKDIADRGGVIVVTLNYRVGPLGFLSTGDARIPGNYGLWDQHAAIAWVRRNIQGFGGDSDNITIFGQSAGAASVTFQIARKLGCPVIDEVKMLLCMRMSDPVGVTMAGKINILGIFGGPVMNLIEYSPVVDGDFLPDHPSMLFDNAADVDFMGGVNSMDGHFFAGVDVASINKRNAPTTAEDVIRLLKGLTKEKGPAAVQSAFDTYSAHWDSTPALVDIKKTVVDIETDFLFLVPTQTTLHLHAQHARRGRTYSYLFDMKTRIPGFPRWVEAEHAEELQYVFGQPFDTPLGYFPRHRTLSDYMISYWTNFAKTGDPSKGNSKVPTTWPIFTLPNNPYLVINSNINMDSVRYNLREKYVRYWTSVYSSLPTVTKTSPE